MEQEQQKVKTKVRFTSLDVSAMVSYFKQNIVGQRVTNIYDINPTTYLFKLSAGENKDYLLVENGVRFHVTSTKAQKNKMPTGFTMKFRKYLRAKRLENIRQVGMERVVVLTFGSENFTNHLILELYSQGNIILTDNEFKIIQCIRSHQFTETVKTAVGELYPFEYAANIYLQTLNPSRDNILQILKKQQNKQSTGEQKKGKKKATQFKLKQLLMKVIPCLYPQASEHIILSQGLNPNEKCNSEDITNIEKAANSAITFLTQFHQNVHQGFLYYTQSSENIKYFDYSPFAPKSYATKLSKTESNFSHAVDLYYADFKKPQNQDDLEGLAWKKYDQIKNDQDARLNKLIADQQQSQHKAELIEKNIDDVDAIIKIIKTMLESGISWGQIQQNINESKKTGNPLAELIHALNLSKNIVTILLEDPTAEAQYSELLPVDIDVTSNAYTNAKYYYEDRKKNKQKQLRTKEASEQVLKVAQREAMKDIEKKKNQRLQNVINMRKPYWFEKFYWMLTSQGYLIISGRDSHQNELLVKKYMKVGDLYMHSDYGGAASTIIKNPTKQPLARPALEQAAIFTVCRSKAWDTKIISGAWWVNSDQVSKSAPTGQFLPTGSFMIRGKKNFIYPNKMQMGITLLYRLDQTSAARHQQNKKPVEQVKVQAYQLQIQKAHEQKLKQQQFSILNLEINTKKKGQQQSQKKDKNTGKQQVTDKKQKIQVNSDEDQSQQQQEDQTPKFKKNQSKQQKQKNKQNQQQQQQQPAPKKNLKKLKKLQKYLEEQDQEERQIIMKMLGAKQMKHRRDQEQQQQQQAPVKGKKKEIKEKKNKDKFNLEQKQQKKLDKQKIPFLMKDDQPIIKKDKKQKHTVKKEQPTQIKQIQQIKLEAQKQSQTQQEKKQQAQQIKQGGQEKKQQKVKSDDDEDDDQQQIQEKQQDNYEEDQKVIDSDMNDLSRLSGVLKMEDTYDAIIAMCAPYPTISENRFKIKLTPGNVKKGKAARNVLNFFTTMDLTEKEKQLLRGIPQQQVINCLVSGVKLAGAGLLKMEMKEKAEKKQKRKQKQKQKQKDKQKKK